MNDLIQQAGAARLSAYAPYSGYKVGAAVRSGVHVWTGVNVENISYGATICAERVAIGKMVTDGATSIDEIAVVTKDGGAPCGICLQTILEFAADPNQVRVHLADEHGLT